jgi:hypothetical protein
MHGIFCTVLNECFFRECRVQQTVGESAIYSHVCIREYVVLPLTTHIVKCGQTSTFSLAYQPCEYGKTSGTSMDRSLKSSDSVIGIVILAYAVRFILSSGDITLLLARTKKSRLSQVRLREELARSFRSRAKISLRSERAEFDTRDLYREHSAYISGSLHLRSPPSASRCWVMSL